MSEQHPDVIKEQNERVNQIDWAKLVIPTDKNKLSEKHCEEQQ